MNWLLAYLALGAFTGFSAGLLGIGGGLVMVPVLTMLFAAQGIAPAVLLPLALGTSMAAILFTSLSSLRVHHAQGGVLWPVVRAITPGILFGTMLGSLVASRVPAGPLAAFFACFVGFVAVQMIADVKPKPTRNLPPPPAMLAVGTGIGTLSSLVAIGGGALTVPFLTWCNVRVQSAIGTSAALGFPIALGGSIGYVFNGWGIAALPGNTLGFVYLPALLGLVASAMLTAPLGARLAHRLPVKTIKRVFAGLLILLAGKMLYSLFS